jgi:adhesin transport system outer membrane protein
VYNGSARADTLDDSVLSALQQHPSVEAAVSSLQSAKESESEQFSNYFPEISMSATAGRMFGNNATSRGLVTTRGQAYSWLGEGSMSVNQRIFDGMETKSRVEAAEARKNKAYHSLFEVREALALRAVQSYLNVLRAREAVKAIKTHTAKVGDYRGRIQNMLKQGAADEVQAQQAQDIKVILDGILADFVGQEKGAEAQYFEAIGYVPGPELEMPKVPLDSVPQDITQAVDYALHNHPSIAVANDESQASAYDIGAEKSALYPDLNGELSYLKRDQRDEIGGEAEDARATMRLSWNFSTGGAQLARIRRSKSTHQGTLSQAEDVRGQIERDVKLAYAEYETAGTQLDLLGQRRELNEKLFKTYQAQFEGAKVNLLQLMQADNQLFNTKLEGINARYRLLSAQYAMLASMGRLQNALHMDQVAMSPDWSQNYAATKPAAGETSANIQIP